MKYVFGHKNPDTDSYCAAVAYATYLQDSGEEAKAIVLWSPNNETSFVFSYAGLALPEIMMSLEQWSEVVLVDHNEASQSIDGRDGLHIDTVIDHHKIADFSTSYPVTMRCEKVGCTCTILHELFKEHWYTPSNKVAILMLSAIISDTLYFRSPTTTDRDRKAVEELATVGWISDTEKYSMDMFTAKSDLWDMPAEDMVTMDYKTFDLSWANIWIGVLETTNPDYALWRKEELLSGMKKVKDTQWLDQLFLCVIDILNEANTTFVLWQEEERTIKDVFWVDTTWSLADLGKRVSRKKQLIPELDKYFQSK